SEIEKMVTDAEQHAADDMKRKEEVEARNTADSAVYSAEKFLADNGANIPESQKAAVQSQIDAVKQALQNNDIPGMQSSVQQLQMVMQQAGAAMYQQGQSADGPTPGGDGAGSDEDVIEGEFSD
ncbi:MAG: Hsp70 family protein, partial [Anaerolineales bacterium]|nr:Hsp70 family protein [Anaerolineales bacterium]